MFLFIFFSVLTLGFIFLAIYSLGKETSQRHNRIIKYLENLSPGEKHLLRESTLDAMIDAIDDTTRKNRVVIADEADVDAFSLVKAGILYRVSKHGNSQILYKIDDFAALHLKDHPNLVL
jgi:hypothetical protein